jgi:hypothetical protein
LELDLLVLEPLGGVDDHPQAQRGFDLDVKKTELELLLALGPEALLQRPRISLRAAVGDEKKAVLPLPAELRDLHAAEQKGLGALQGGDGGSKIDLVEPESQHCQSQQADPDADQQAAFEAGHGIFAAPVGCGFMFIG